MNDNDEIPVTLPDPQAVLEKARIDQEIRDIHETALEMWGPQDLELFTDRSNR